MAYSALEAMVGWLASLDYRASTVVPPDAPGEFVTVERTGGGVDSYVDKPVFAVQAWAATDARAEEIANAIRYAALTTAPPAGIHSFTGFDGPYRFYDESTRSPRHQLVIYASAQLAIND